MLRSGTPTLLGSSSWSRPDQPKTRVSGLFRAWKTYLLTAARVLREQAAFLHITAGVLLVAWGAGPPFSPRLVVVGLYVLFWVGWENIYTIGRFGIYMLSDIHRLTGTGGSE